MNGTADSHHFISPVEPSVNERVSQVPSNEPHSAEGDENDHWSGDDSGAEDGDSKKRKRPMSVSCELCKQRKVKCDRGQPACGWCMRNNQHCEYRERKKPGLRAGYGKELEARLDRLESLIERQQSAIAQLTNHSIGARSHTSPSHSHASPRNPSDGSVFRSPPALTTPHIPRPETALFIQKPSSFQAQQGLNDYGLPGRGSISIPHSTPYQQPTEFGNAETPRDLYQNTNPPLESPSLNINAPPPQSSAIIPQEHDFPPYDLLYALADLFFKHINTWCPILHRRSTLDSLFGPSTLEEADRILLHAIVATTLRFSVDSRLTPESRERYHEVSKQKVLLYGMENSSVKALQALVILALDLVGIGNGPPGWNLLALITRSVVQLGLAVETTSSIVAPNYPSIYTLRAMVLPEPKDFIEEESRRRLFWMVYLLDRYATVATAFEFALDEKEIDRKLPCRDDLFARNQAVETKWFHPLERHDHNSAHRDSLGSFSYYIEIIGILTRIHVFLKKPIDIGSLDDVERWQGEYRELDSAIGSWKFSLPNEYGNMSRIFGSGAGNKVVNCGWVMLHAAYNTTVIRLHSSAAYPTTRSPIFTPSYSASQRCLTAVENIVALCDYVKTNNLLTKLGPMFAFSLWVAARVLLVHGSTIDQQVNPSINTLVDTLREMGVYWKVAERYGTLLQRVLDEYRESQRAPTIAPNGERVTPSTVRILADMRRCAFDLDFLISRQPARRNGIPDTSRLPSVTPARTPAPNDFEYLDVFDFFNMPRLPLSMEPTPSASVQPGQQREAEGEGQQGAGGLVGQMPDLGRDNEFNITNFMMDANSDWFMRNGST